MSHRAGASCPRTRSGSREGSTPIFMAALTRSTSPIRLAETVTGSTIGLVRGTRVESGRAPPAEGAPGQPGAEAIVAPSVAPAVTSGPEAQADLVTGEMAAVSGPIPHSRGRPAPLVRLSGRPPEVSTTYRRGLVPALLERRKGCLIPTKESIFSWPLARQ